MTGKIIWTNYWARTLGLMLIVSLTCALASAQKKQIRVAAAADLQTVMPEIAKAFEAQTGIHVDVAYGSSGNFYVQIRNGAPMDVFFSADSEYPMKIEQAGLAEPNSEVIYAVGRIVLWMPGTGSCDPQQQEWKCLLGRDVEKIAIANPFVVIRKRNKKDNFFLTFP